MAAIRHPHTHQWLVTEQRRKDLSFWYALPKQHQARIADQERTGTWLPKYQDFDGHVRLAVRCMKCGRVIVHAQPMLYLPPASKKGDPAQQLMLDGQLQATMLPNNSYRQGSAVMKDGYGRIHRIDYLHCADCTIKEEHLPDVIAVTVAGLHHEREAMKRVMPHELGNDDVWATHLAQYSGTEPIGLEGPSAGLEHMMNEALALNATIEAERKRES